MSKGERIKHLRKIYKLTLNDLADRLGTTKQTVFKYENDIVTNIPSDKIEALASVLHTSPAYLMGLGGTIFSGFIWDLWAFLGYFGSECA